MLTVRICKHRMSCVCQLDSPSVPSVGVSSRVRPLQPPPLLRDQPGQLLCPRCCAQSLVHELMLFCFLIRITIHLSSYRVSDSVSEVPDKRDRA